MAGFDVGTGPLADRELSALDLMDMSSALKPGRHTAEDATAAPATLRNERLCCMRIIGFDQVWRSRFTTRVYVVPPMSQQMATSHDLFDNPHRHLKKGSARGQRLKTKG